MNLNYSVHKDHRRTLYEWIENENFCTSKVVIAKDEIPIGDHYHNNKDEIFFLVQGRFLSIEVGDYINKDLIAPCRISIPRGTWHRFILEKGSILLCASNAPFDINDEIKL